MNSFSWYFMIFLHCANYIHCINSKHPATLNCLPTEDFGLSVPLLKYLGHPIFPCVQTPLFKKIM